MRGKFKRIQTTLIFALLMMMACVESYYPPSSTSDMELLVVDGFLNGTSSSATVKLTRSVPLSISIPFPPETGANVSIENTEGDSFSLAETDKGVYEADHLNLDPSTGYRLTIETSSGASYASDFIGLRQSPALDSVSWVPEETGTRFYVSGHDPSNKTIFYRYLFTETWEYNVTYFSYFRNEGGTPVLRNLGAGDQVYNCWTNSLNTEVLTASTKGLGRDRVSMLPINFIKKGSRQLSYLYSMLVQQRAISQEEYEYWGLIKKTTESLGGLFDPLPSEVSGNVHNETDASEKVLGYFSGGYVQEKRIFVRNSELPPALRGVERWDFDCEVKSIPYDQPQLVGTDVFLGTVGIPPVAWSITTPNCGDCRSLSGDNIKPDYWPQ
jgi:hypothetical protein